jgi:hypothetical protein
MVPGERPALSDGLFNDSILLPSGISPAEILSLYLSVHLPQYTITP